MAIGPLDTFQHKPGCDPACAKENIRRGRKLLKLGFAVLGIVIGGGVGYLAALAAGFAINPFIPAAVTAIIGLLFGWLTFRFAVATSMGMLFTAVAPLIVLPLVMDEQDAGAAYKGALSPEELFLDDVPIVDGELPTATSKVIESLISTSDLEEVGEELKDAAGKRIRKFAGELFEEAERSWLGIPVRLRVGMVLGGMATFLTGFGLGLLLPKHAAGLLTASVGAGIWLPGLIWLGYAAHLNLGAILPEKPFIWACVWLSLTIIGAFIQWRKRRPRADKEDSVSSS